MIFVFSLLSLVLADSCVASPEGICEDGLALLQLHAGKTGGKGKCKDDEGKPKPEGASCTKSKKGRTSTGKCSKTAKGWLACKSVCFGVANLEPCQKTVNGEVVKGTCMDGKTNPKTGKKNRLCKTGKEKVWSLLQTGGKGKCKGLSEGASCTKSKKGRTSTGKCAKTSKGWMACKSVCFGSPNGSTCKKTVHAEGKDPEVWEGKCMDGKINPKTKKPNRLCKTGKEKVWT